MLVLQNYEENLWFHEFTVISVGDFQEFENHRHGCSYCIKHLSNFKTAQHQLKGRCFLLQKLNSTLEISLFRFFIAQLLSFVTFSIA